MLLLPVLALAPAAGGGFFLVTDAVHPALESYVRVGGGLRRVSRVPLSEGRYPSVAGVDERRRLAYVLTLGADGKPGSFAAFRYDARGRLSRGAVTPVERATGAIAFSPTGKYAAVLSEQNARTYRVGADGALGPLDRKALYGGTGDAVVAVTSGDGRRLFRLAYGAYIDTNWTNVHAYAWRGDGTLENRGAAEQWRQKDAWGQENFDSFVPEARGRFGYLVGSVVLRLRLGARMQGRIVLRRAYDAVARDDARRGIYLVKDGRVDWASDGALDRPRTLGHIGGLMGPASCADYDAGRRELFVSTQDREGSWVGVYGIGGGLRLHKRLEARLGRGRSVAVWVTR